MVSIFPSGRMARVALDLLQSKLEALREEGVDKLPPERELAVELGVSRRVVREALSSLEIEGHITRARGRGTMILRPGSVAWGQGASLKRYTSPAELMEARLVLEPAIAALAATHASSRDLEDMREYIHQGRSASEASAWERWDGALHKAIGASTYNALLIRFSDMLNESRKETAWGRLHRNSLTTGRREAYVRQHEAIVAAIADHDPAQAARAMRKHLMAVRHTMLEQLDEVDGEID